MYYQSFLLIMEKIMEKLKTNLGFLGNKKDRIYVNIPGIDSDLLTIRVDNYKKPLNI